MLINFCKICRLSKRFIALTPCASGLSGYSIYRVRCNVGTFILYSMSWVLNRVFTAKKEKERKMSERAGNGPKRWPWLPQLTELKKSRNGKERKKMMKKTRKKFSLFCIYANLSLEAIDDGPWKCLLFPPLQYEWMYEWTSGIMHLKSSLRIFFQTSYWIARLNTFSPAVVMTSHPSYGT